MRLFTNALIVCLLVLAVGWSPSASALTINLAWLGPGSGTPHPAAVTESLDPTGALLMAHMRQAADEWEALIEDNHTMSIAVFYSTTAYVGTSTASMDIWTRDATNRRTVTGRAAFSIDLDAYYDPTPGDDSEFSPFQQTLVGDLSPTAQAAGFNLPPGPPLPLEVSYQAGQFLAGNRDLLTVAPARAGAPGRPEPRGHGGVCRRRLRHPGQSSRWFGRGREGPRPFRRVRAAHVGLSADRCAGRPSPPPTCWPPPRAATGRSSTSSG